MAAMILLILTVMRSRRAVEKLGAELAGAEETLPWGQIHVIYRLTPQRWGAGCRAGLRAGADAVTIVCSAALIKIKIRIFAIEAHREPKARVSSGLRLLPLSASDWISASPLKGEKTRETIGRVHGSRRRLQI
jgi:hypothetical protein